MRGAVAASVLGIAVAVAGLVNACSSSSSAQGSGLDDASVANAGCLPVPNASCAPYSPGAHCPGSSQECVACGPGSYTFAASLCTCGSASTWSCGPGTATCASPVGQYVDPACTILYPGDASIEEQDGAVGFDAGSDASADSGSDAATDLDATGASDVIDANEDEDASG